MQAVHMAGDRENEGRVRGRVKTWLMLLCPARIPIFSLLNNSATCATKLSGSMAGGGGKGQEGGWEGDIVRKEN